jgi:hypothetical protein
MTGSTPESKTPALCGLAGAGCDGGLYARAAAILDADPLVGATLEAMARAAPPGAWLVSGAVYGAIWNALTGRAPGYGIKDLDVVYFDADRSWAAEDRAIRSFAEAAPAGPPVELRNQARTHLWWPERFGGAYPPLRGALESLIYYASIAHAVAVRRGPAGLDIAAPFGLEDVFAMRLRPNRRLANRATHEEKGARILRRWPEARVEPW